jgi:hypothetical protein
LWQAFFNFETLEKALSSWSDYICITYEISSIGYERAKANGVSPTI